MNISWRDLIVGDTYYTKMIGQTFGLPNDYKKIVIQRIQYLQNNEAMIFTILETGQIMGFASGGKFEDPFLGPRNRFWKSIQEPTYLGTNISAAAA